MKYKTQLLCDEIIIEGMLAAADKYCDSHLCLDLAEYVDWLSFHDLQARCCRVPGVKGFCHKRKLQWITDGVNQALQSKGAYITRDCVDPVRLQVVEKEINEFFVNRESGKEEKNTS